MEELGYLDGDIDVTIRSCLSPRKDMKQQIKRAKEILSLLTDEEKQEFIRCVDEDFGCQWDGNWQRENSVFTELYKLLSVEALEKI